MLLVLGTFIIDEGIVTAKNTPKILLRNKNNIIECTIPKKIINEEIVFTNENWLLEIPKINLKANIEHGTTKEVMDKYIGHFETTMFWEGNIGLAAHNRGYPVNYFKRLKELQIGDEINYTTVFGTKTYKIVISTIIQDTDWSYLENTEDNRITLITCVENQPNYRRCIQGIEI